MSDYIFDVTQFRIDYPQFSNSTTFPDVTLTSYWYQGFGIVSSRNYGYLEGLARFRALNLITAHLSAISAIIAAGRTPYIMASATISSESISLDPPPKPDQFQWWLNTTPYGQQLLAMLQVKATGGIYIGGSPVRSGFRQFRGGF
jgi:hypothetical protein